MEVLLFIWGIVIGAVFSTVGAAGGILAGFGHISLFGIASANTVKVMNQVLILLSTFISVPNYWRQGRVIFILGGLLGIGSILGALAGSTLSYKYLTNLRDYKFIFGILTLVVALKIFYDVFHKEKERIKKIDTGIRGEGERKVKIESRSLKKVVYKFLGEEHSFNPLYPLIAGFVVAVISSALGVGGGFLLVPFMVSVLKVPMYLVPGTSAFSILITSLVSILNYINLGVSVKWYFVFYEALGVVIGSFMGPHISHILGEKRLRIILGVILFGIGLRYIFI
ncbi:sulfite exporter TauE/SafE family protein [Aquifex pyrophilus]